MALSAKQLERGKALWDDARRCTGSGGELGALRDWAGQCRCAEADRLLAKALVQVAVNRMISWASENLRKLQNLSKETRTQMELTLELEVVALFNEALGVAARSAHNHNSLQCFYLGCLVAHAVRGRANVVHMISRVGDLRRLDEKRREWRDAGGSSSAPWASPGAERVIGERAPFETDSRHAAGWATHALQLGGQRLDEALRDEQACMDHWGRAGRTPDPPKGCSLHAVVLDVAASLPVRLALLHELVSEERRREWSGLLATGTMRIAGGGPNASKHDMQHKMSQQAAQSLKLQQAQLKLREQRERRMLEAAAATAAPGAAGGAGGVGDGTLVALDTPTQEDLRRYIERRLHAAATAAADPGSDGKVKWRPTKPAAGPLLPNLPAAAAPVSALQSLVRVPLAELATAATRLAQQGALPQQTAKRVKDLVGRLAAKDSDSPRGVAARSGGPRLRSGRMFRFPPPEGLAASAAVPGRPAGLGLGLSQRGKQAKQAEVLCELPTPEALTAYLHASYLGEGEAAQAAAAPAIESLLVRLPGVRRLLDSLPRHKRGLQVLRGDDVAEPPAVLPHPDTLAFEEKLAQDVAFVKLALRGPSQGSIHSAEELLAAVQSCAPALKNREAGLGALEGLAGGAGGAPGAAAWWDGGGSEVFLELGDSHLRGRFTTLDMYVLKCATLWLPVAEAAVGISGVLPHGGDASFPRHVVAMAQKVHPGEPGTEAALSRMLLGGAMLRALRSRREGHAGCPQEDRIDALLRRPLLKPEALLGLIGVDAQAAQALQPSTTGIVRAACEGDAAAGAIAAGSESLLSSTAGGASDGTLEPPPVQVAAAALLASVLVHQPLGARFKLDQLNGERKELSAAVLAGLRQLLQRQRLTRLAARCICDFVRMALRETGGQGAPPDCRSLPACMERLGSLPLVAVAQLAAFVYQLVGLSFLQLADLDPDAFQDLAGGRDLPAGLAGCDVRLTDRGLAELLGVPLLAEPGAAGGALLLTRASSGSGGGLQLVRSSSGACGGDGKGDDTAVQELLPQAAQRLAAYAAHGGGADRERDNSAAAVRRWSRPGCSGSGCSWTGVLSALQQQAFLTGVLLDLWQWLEATTALTLSATNSLTSFSLAASEARRMGGGGLADMPVSELQRLVCEVKAVLPQSMLALALSGHAWASLEHSMHSALMRQCEEGDDSLGRKLQARQLPRPAEPLAEGARAQLRVFRNLTLGHLSQLEGKLQLTEHLAEHDGAASVQEDMLHVLRPLDDYLQRLEAAQGSGGPAPSDQLAEEARVALLLLGDAIYAELKDAAGMQDQLAGLLDCFHLRTQLLLSELHARCHVHPPSELMGLALREVLPLQWQQEWRRMQESSSDALMAELLAEEEEQQQREMKKAQKAAKKKAQKKGGGSEAASTSAASTRGNPEAGAETEPSPDAEALTQHTGTAASTAAGTSRWTDGGSGNRELPDSWEGLRQTAAEAVAAAERGVPLPPGYVRTMQQLEAEERGEEQQRPQQAQAAAAATAGNAGADQAEAGKKKGRKKKKGRGAGEAAEEPSPAAATEQQEEEGGEWQAVGKKGPRRQQQAEQQTEQQQAQQAQQAKQASGARVLTVPRSTTQSVPPPPASLPQPPTPPPGLQALRLAKEPPQQAGQQQAQQAEQSPRWQTLAAGGQAQQPVQRAGQAQAALGGLWHGWDPQPQTHLDAGAAAFAPSAPAGLPGLPGDLAEGPVQRLRADSEPLALSSKQLGPAGRSLFDLPSPPGQRSQSLFSQPLLGEQPSMQGALPLSLGPLPDQLPAEPDLAEDPRLLWPLPGRQPQPGGPTTQAPLQQQQRARAATVEDDLTYLQWLGVGEGQAGLASAANAALAAAAAAGSPTFAAGPVQQLDPQLGGLGLEPPLPALPGGGLVDMPQQPVDSSVLQQPGVGLEKAGSSLFSAPLATHSPAMRHPPGFPGPLGLPAAAPGLQPPPEAQPLGLGGGFLSVAAPAVDPETLAAAAAAAKLGGCAREPAPLLAAYLPQQQAQQSQHHALLAQQQPQQAQHRGENTLADWAAQQAQQALASPPHLDAELDSLYQMLGVSDSGQAAAAAEAWGAAAARAQPQHVHASAVSREGLQAPAPAAPLSLAGAAAGHATGAQKHNAGGEADAALGLAGLRNEAGEYNCFLNVIVQCLWRCTEFRQQVLAWDVAAIGHNHVACALHRLFCSLQLAAASGSGGAPVAVDPSELREALAALPNQLFRLGEMCDAGETLLSMFERVREASPGTRATLDLLFGLKVAESVNCGHCGRVTHKNAYTQYFYNTRASALRRVIAQAAEGRRRGIIGPKTLGARLRAIEEQVHKSCDTDHGGCNKAVPVTTRLEAAPRVFSLQIAWQSNTESPQAIAATLAAVDESLDLAEVYTASARTGLRRYRLRSMVCYYGQHYQALVLVPEAGGWLVFDDTRVARVGSWEAVQRKCEAGRIQPSVLFYEAEAAA